MHNFECPGTGAGFGLSWGGTNKKKGLTCDQDGVSVTPCLWPCVREHTIFRIFVQFERISPEVPYSKASFVTIVSATVKPYLWAQQKLYLRVYRQIVGHCAVVHPVGHNFQSWLFPIKSALSALSILNYTALHPGLPSPEPSVVLLKTQLTHKAVPYLSELPAACCCECTKQIHNLTAARNGKDFSNLLWGSVCNTIHTCQN